MANNQNRSDISELMEFVKQHRDGWALAFPPEEASKLAGILRDCELAIVSQEYAALKDRIRKIKAATAQGCLSAALGEPLHTVAASGHAPRSYEGDAWEAGWEYIHGSATWQNYVETTIARLSEQIALKSIEDEAAKTMAFEVARKYVESRLQPFGENLQERIERNARSHTDNLFLLLTQRLDKMEGQLQFLASVLAPAVVPTVKPKAAKSSKRKAVKRGR